MDERTLIKSERVSIMPFKTIICIMLSVIIILTLYLIVCNTNEYMSKNKMEKLESEMESYRSHATELASVFSDKYIEYLNFQSTKNKEAYENAEKEYQAANNEYYTVTSWYDTARENYEDACDNTSNAEKRCMMICIPVIVIIMFSLLALYYLKSTFVEVNRDRVSGKILWKQVDLPLDSVSAVSTGGLKSIGISTSSGKIAFWGIQNRDEIYTVLKELLTERQKTVPIASQVSTPDELKKYKELLDSGVITQEEFDAKKKDILGL